MTNWLGSLLSEDVLPSDHPILIVGGGLGGLTTALALAQRGRSVRVLEGAPEFGAIGYGIQFGPNVFHVLDRIGVSDAVRQKADAPPAVLMIDALTGAEVTRVPTGPSFRDRFKHPYIIIHRIDLHLALLDACKRSDRIELVPDAMVAGFEDRGDRVTATTEDGRTFEGAAIVGADGLRSRIRAQLFDDGDPHPIGFVAHRTIVPMADVTADVPRDVVVLWAGPGFHIVHYPLRHGTLFNIVAVFRTSTYSEKGDVASYRARAAAHLSVRPSLHEGTARDDGSGAALADRRPRSDPALAQGQGGAARRCRASDLAVFGARRLHGDRGRPLPGRAHACGGRRLRGRVPPLCRRPACADRAGDAGVRVIFGRSITPTALPGTCIGRCWASAARPIPSSASPGSMTGLHFPARAPFIWHHLAFVIPDARACARSGIHNHRLSYIARPGVMDSGLAGQRARAPE